MRTRAFVPHCLVTGSASGIGLALTRRLLPAGWRVCGVDRQPQPDLLDPAYEGHVVDLEDETATAALASRLRDRDLTAIVHCAGLMRSGGTADTRSGDVDRLWNVHVVAPMALLRELAAELPDHHGRVVLVSSRAVLGRADRAAYCATKAAQIGLARSWAAELIGRGITVNVVAPGAVDTPMLTDPQRGAPARIELPLGRLIDANEVAAAIAFLISEEAGAVTGQTLYVCGGASLGTAAF